jgi:DNA-binding CsgD family transcriptional regulator
MQGDGAARGYSDGRPWGKGIAVIRTEEIYDAATDDAAFSQLASRLADAAGARSGVLHWGHGATDIAEISYSGYFSGDQMAVYDEEFVYDDIWGKAMESHAANRVWDCEAFVPGEAFGDSRIYNEWIRPMGDDTYRCLGGVIRHGETTGHIGLHRGRTQAVFDGRDLQVVQDCVDHLGRLFDIRRRLNRATHYGRSLHATLDMVEHAVFTLSAGGTMIDCNRAADAMLRRQDVLMMRQRRLVARDGHDDGALQAALRAAGAREGAQGGAVLLQREAGPPYMVSLAPVWTGQARQTVLIVTDPDSRDTSLSSRVRALYGLTRAEAEIVTALCDGRALEQLSQERGVALSTVRTQMKAIYLKMDCSRQSELVARVARLPRFTGRED